uniref:Reverse transcriptase domain-containing protein n=1 Tax=Haemonchus contortus TaxID=6289 RepID=A0A7I4XSR1_HAECO
MKTGTISGPEKISADLLRAGGYELHALLTTHMTSYLQKEKIPNQWRNSRMVILHKKGDLDDLRKCRPMSLLSVLYELFTKIILTRMSRTLDGAQPVEQAGFQRNSAA